MASSKCCAADQQFDPGIARRDLRRFVRRGPDAATGQLLAAVEEAPLPARPTLIDVGGGIGAIHHTLLAHRFASATQIDASQAYLTVAAEEAARRGHRSRVTFVHGDFRALAPSIAAADVVTLDRVVCCDPDYTSLLGAAADHARRALAFTYPRPRFVTRAFVATTNHWRQLRGRPFRAFVHSPEAMRAVVESRGFGRRWTGGTWIWAAVVFERR